MLTNGPPSQGAPCPLIVSGEVGEVQRVLTSDRRVSASTAAATLVAASAVLMVVSAGAGGVVESHVEFVAMLCDA